MSWSTVLGGVIWAAVVFPVAWSLGFTLDWRLGVLLGVSCIVDALTSKRAT